MRSSQPQPGAPELSRIEEALADQEQAEVLVSRWVAVAEDIGGVAINESPDIETLHRLFIELDITGIMRTQEERDSLYAKQEAFLMAMPESEKVQMRQDAAKIRMFFAYVPWIKVTALVIDPAMSIADPTARRSVTNQQRLLVEAGVERWDASSS